MHPTPTWNMQAEALTDDLPPFTSILQCKVVEFPLSLPWVTPSLAPGFTVSLTFAIDSPSMLIISIVIVLDHWLTLLLCTQVRDPDYQQNPSLKALYIGWPPGMLQLLQI